MCTHIEVIQQKQYHAVARAARILCSTGSGKTSLVNALAGRLEGGELQGSILVNGRDRTKSFKNISGCAVAAAMRSATWRK